MKVNSLALVGVVLIALTSSCASPRHKELSKSEKVSGLLSIAASAITDGNPISALETLNQIRDLDDSIPREYYLYSLAYLKKNEVRLATDSARMAVRLDPHYSEAKNTLGKILLDQGNFDEAETLLKESATDIMFRESYLPKINLGILYFKKMNLAESERWLSSAVSEDGPMTCLAQFYLGKISLERKSFSSAERSFASATHGNCSALREAHLAVGQTFVREKKYDQARVKFVEIQRLFPNSETYDQATQYLRELP